MECSVILKGGNYDNKYNTVKQTSIRNYTSEELKYLLYVLGPSIIKRWPIL